jgi:uncharacterized NAD(P)/FAD-binding protein YdhS
VLPRAIDPDVLGVAYVHDPWATDALDRLPASGRVLLLGSGLTMVDVAIALRERGGLELAALSRRGMLPRTFAPAGAPPELRLPVESPTARSLVRAVRAAVAAVPEGDWPAVFAALRPRTRELWAALDVAEQRRLLTRVGRYWDIHRHRMAPAVAAQLEELRAAGRLSLRAGEIAHTERLDGRIDVTVARPGCAHESLQVDAIVNCTGPATSPAAGGPLVRALLDRGLVRPDPLDAGLAVTPASRLLDGDGGTSPLLALGWLCRGTRFESTAVPELRADAAQVAREALAIGSSAHRLRAATISGS